MIETIPLTNNHTGKGTQEKKGTSKRRRYLESREQTYFFNWINAHFPEHARNLVFAIPNGGSRAAIQLRQPDGSFKRVSLEGKRLKMEGVKAGVPDVFISVPRGTYHGFYLEFKKPSVNKLSHEQALFFDSATRNGYRCLMVNNYMEARKAILEYFNVEKLSDITNV